MPLKNGDGVGHRWQKGQSGNPSGRPKLAPECREMARSYTREAIDTLARLMRGAESESARVRAAEVLLDRGWGKPTQPIAGDDENPLVLMTAEQRQRELEDKRRLALNALEAAFEVIEQQDSAAADQRRLVLPPQGTG